MSSIPIHGRKLGATLVGHLRFLRLSLAALIPSFCFFPQGFAAETRTVEYPDRGPAMVVNEENDLFVNTDREYTQGIKVAYLHADNHMPLGFAALNERIPAWGFDKHSGRLGYTVGQNMYTPADVDTPNLIPNDRPYAGWLYMGVTLIRLGETRTFHRPVQESIELEIGVTGSASLAERSQIWIHQIRGFSLPQGWRNQLRTEPGFRLKYERSYRYDLLGSGDGFRMDLIPWAGVVVGTIEDSVRLGGQLRIGWLPNQFGQRIIDSMSTTSAGKSKSNPRNWAAHGFMGAEGRFVGRNAFLDGNLFHESHSVDKNLGVGDFIAGFVVSLHHLDLGYTHVFRTPEARHQTEAHQFGSVYAAIRF